MRSLFGIAAVLAASLACGGPAGTIAVVPEAPAEPATTTVPAAAAPDDAEADAALPDIFLVVWDTTRPDHLTPYGYERDTTPFLNTLAEQGAVFENAFATSYWTMPSMTGLFTGLFTHNHKVSYQAEDYTIRLGDGPVPIGRVLKDAGYATALYAVVGLLEDAGLTDGFDDVQVMGPAKIGPATLQFVDAHPDQPRFVVLYYRDPHAPYHPPDKHDVWSDEALPDAYLGVAKHEVAKKKDKGWYLIHDVAEGTADLEPGQWRQLVNHYDGELKFNDGLLRAFWGGLTKRGLADDAVFAFTSDHGEAFNEHAEWPVGHRHPHDEVLRIPLIVRYPERFPAGTRVTDNVRNFDLYPTLLRAAGLKVRNPINARPLAAVMERTHDREVIGFGHTYCAPQFYRDKHYKIVSCRRGEPRWELFDLVADPDETTNLAETRPKMLENYQRKLATRLAATTLEVVQAPGELAGDAEKEALEAIGYIE